MTVSRHSRAAAAFVLAVGVVLGSLTITSCGGNDNGGGSGLNSNSVDDTRRSENSSNAAPQSSSANPLWGTWTAPCDRILAALMGEPKLPEEMTCTGNYVMELSPDGSYNQSGGGKVTVTAPDGEFTTSYPWTGHQTSTWTAESTDGGTKGTMKIAADVWVYESSAAPIEDDYPTLESDPLEIVPLVPSTTSISVVRGDIPYVVNGNTLTMWRRFPELGVVELTYTRK